MEGTKRSDDQHGLYHRRLKANSKPVPISEVKENMQQNPYINQFNMRKGFK